MKLIKKLATTTLIFTAIGTNFIFADSTMTSPDTCDITQSKESPYAMACSCGGSLLPSNTFTSWGRTGSSRQCKSHSSHSGDYRYREYQESRVVTSRLKCSKCGIIINQGSKTEKRWVCIKAA